jgi:hypothetical protein
MLLSVKQLPRLPHRSAKTWHRADHPGEDRPTTAPAEPRLPRRETTKVRPGDLPATQYDQALLQPTQGLPRDRHQIRKDRHLLRSGAHPRIVSALGKIGLKTDSSRPRSDRPVRRLRSCPPCIARLLPARRVGSHPLRPPRAEGVSAAVRGTRTWRTPLSYRAKFNYTSSVTDCGTETAGTTRPRV